MSISIQNITKVYGEQKALDNISLEISPGHIVGLLGPNGAGKTTLMKILTGFIPPTFGQAKIDGKDIFEDALEIRKIIGYLPEHNPLYHEMYIREYLEFIGGIYKINNLKQRVDEMIELTGLTPERTKKISALSKGFRQRVGLAQALIHEPKILILDEPTSGLDPNQLVEIRNLISKIGSDRTVLLSTHIMQEVEAICDRAIIISKGKIVADDTTGNLQNLKESEVVLIVEFNKQIAPEKLQTMEGIKSIEKLKANTWKILTSGGKDLREDIFKWAVSENLSVLSLQKKEHTLEQVFQELTS
jgi:ABC-2 type transport system ATP-binding protein